MIRVQNRFGDVKSVVLNSVTQRKSYVMMKAYTTQASCLHRRFTVALH